MTGKLTANHEGTSTHSTRCCDDGISMYRLVVQLLENPVDDAIQGKELISRRHL
jgi:hypothetical protein